MDHHKYKYKYTKYKSKYQNLLEQRGGSLQKLNNLVIYSDKSLVTIRISSNTELLNGFIPDSVIFLTDDGMLDKSIISNNNTFDQALLQNKKVEIEMDDGEKIAGKILSIDQKTISFIDDENKLHIVKKWKDITMNNIRPNKTMFLTKKEGALQYMVNSINWYPIYNFYLNPMSTSDASNGILYLSAFINNNTGSDILADKIILVSGSIKKEKLVRMQTMTNGSTKQTPFNELLTYPIDHQIRILGEKYLVLLDKYYTDTSVLYIVDVGNHYTKNKDYVEAYYGYKILAKENDLPEGTVRIFATEPKTNTTILMGSTHIDRTPKNTYMEMIIGKTSRIRVKYNKDISSDKQTNHKNSLNYITNTIKITGIIYNDTGAEQNVTIRDWIGEHIPILSQPEANQIGENLEWKINSTRGETTFVLVYKIQYYK